MIDHEIYNYKSTNTDLLNLLAFIKETSRGAVRQPSNCYQYFPRFSNSHFFLKRNFLEFNIARIQFFISLILPRWENRNYERIQAIIALGRIIQNRKKLKIKNLLEKISSLHYRFYF